MHKFWVFLMGAVVAVTFGFLEAEAFSDLWLDDEDLSSDDGDLPAWFATATASGLAILAAWWLKPGWRLPLGLSPAILAGALFLPMEATDFELLGKAIVSHGLLALGLAGAHLICKGAGIQGMPGRLMDWLGPIVCQFAALSFLVVLADSLEEFGEQLLGGGIALIACLFIWFRIPTRRWIILIIPVLLLVVVSVDELELLELDVLSTAVEYGNWSMLVHLLILVGLAELVTRRLLSRPDGDRQLRRLFTKIAFVSVVAVLLVFGLVLMRVGYPFAWNFSLPAPEMGLQSTMQSGGGSYWMPLPLILNINAISLLLVPVFWSARRVLFGVGRPWLAGITMFCWIATWWIFVWAEMESRKPWWPLVLASDNEALEERVEANSNQDFQMGDLKLLAEMDIDEVCRDAPLYQAKQFIVARNGLPGQVAVPEDVMTRGLLESGTCPPGRTVQLQRLSKAVSTIHGLYDGSGKPVPRNSMKHSLWTTSALLGENPDVDSAIVKTQDAHPADFLAREVALAEMEVELLSKGQPGEGTWLPTTGAYDAASSLYISVDAKYWHVANTPLEQWSYWYRLVGKDGSETRRLAQVICRSPERVKRLFSISTRGSATAIKVEDLTDDIQPGDPEWNINQYVCSGQTDALTRKPPLAVEAAGASDASQAADPPEPVRAEPAPTVATVAPSQPTQREVRGTSMAVSSDPNPARLKSRKPHVATIE